MQTQKVKGHRSPCRLPGYARTRSFFFMYSCCKLRLQLYTFFWRFLFECSELSSPKMTTLAKTLFFSCFGCARRLRRPEPRLLTREMKEHDRRVVWTTGLTFQLEVGNAYNIFCSVRIYYPFYFPSLVAFGIQ